MPSFLPDRDTGATYNALGKVNYQNLPPANVTGVNNTDWDNPSLAGAVCNIAGLGLTAPRFTCRMQLATTTGGLSIPNWYAVWKNATSTAPVPNRSTTGTYTITLPTTVLDEYNNSLSNGITHSVQLFMAVGNVEGSTYGHLQCSANANVITIYSFNSTPVLADSTAIISVVAF